MTEDRARVRVLVVGGASRAARAFRRRAATEADLSITVLARQPIEALQGETVSLTRDYFAPAPGVLHEAEVVVNFAGAPTQPTEAALFQLNAEGPIQLARAAREVGVRQFIQISSLSIFGAAENVHDGAPTVPLTAYGRSKLAAELGLQALSGESFAVLLVRAPLIYGPDGGGKLSSLARLFSLAPIFPVPPVMEPRSMVHVDNLAAALVTAIRERMAGSVFAVDPEPFDLRRLAGALRAAGRKSPRLVTAPAAVFRALSRAAPALHASLYGRSLIGGAGGLPRPGDALPLSATLPDVFA